jgi:hypothetical protein
MNPMRLLSIVLSLSLVSVVCFGQTQSQDPNFKRFEYGLSGGILLPATISMDMLDDNVVTSISPMFRLYADVNIIEFFSLGCYVNLAPASIDKLESHPATIPSDYKSAFAYEFGGSFKVPIRLTPTFRMTPAFSVGYRRIHSKFASEVQWSYNGPVEKTGDVNGLALNGQVQFTLLTGGLVSPFLEVGFLTQPVGGNKFTTMTWAPVFFFVAGVCI